MTTKTEVLQREFERIRKKYKGKLTRQIIVKEAQDEKSILHKEFDWIDKSAAHKQRLDRAQELLSRYVTVRVVERNTTFRFPMYVRNADLPPNVGGFISTRDSMTRSSAARLVDAELDRIESSVERGRAISDSLDLRHPGLSAYFEKMLATVAAARMLLGKKAA